MDYYTFEIMNLYQHHIVHTRVQKRRFVVRSWMVMILFVVLCGVAFGSSFLFADYGKTLATTISYMYDPVNPLYNDLGHIVFTNSVGYAEYNVEKTVTFTVPVISNKMTIQTDHIAFEIVDSVMVVASADGVVLKVGTMENGGKYVELKHSKSLVTRYENIDIAGVVPGEVVKSGQDIATAKVGAVVKFSILRNAVAVTNLTLQQNKVVWQS